jgi:N-methylhydantoinase A
VSAARNGHNNDAAIELGVDIGGTFTDLVMRAGGRLRSHKVPTTPRDPSAAVAIGVSELLERHSVAPADVSRFVHGTTLVANAILERHGAKTALVTTEGFRDVLEIGRERRFDVYDLSIMRPEPIVERALRFEVSERIAANGAVIEPLAEDELVLLAARLRGLGIESVAVAFLHAFRNTDHERRAREILVAEVPGVHVSLSSDVGAEIGEYERTSTVTLDAFVKPLVAQYLGRLRERLDGLSCRAPILLMQSNGGFIHADDAVRYPIRLLESGPAAGCVFASALSESVKPLRTVAFDMGGTTAKTCYMQPDGQPERGRAFEVARAHRFKRNSGLPVRIPAVDLVEIGAGGGSIARINDLGMLDVGPESAAADPGPACYGFGGRLPTVTDAALVLGYLDADHFLGGAIVLDHRAAEEAIETIARPLGLSITAAAWAIHDVVTKKMAYNAQMHAMEKAIALTDCALVAFGGAGPLHAYRMARELGVTTIIVPRYAGVASAMGLLMAPPAVDVTRGYMHALESLRPDDVEHVLSQLEDDALRQVRQASIGAEISVTRAVDVRYRGQGETLEIELGGVNGDHIVDGVRLRFEEHYSSLYGRRLAGHAIEVLNWHVIAAGRPRSFSEQDLDETLAYRDEAAAPSGGRSMIDPDTGLTAEAQAYDRSALADAGIVTGPALIVDAACTMIVGSRGKAEVAMSDGAVRIHLL